MTRLFSLLFIKYDSKFRFNDIDEELVEDLDNRLTAIYKSYGALPKKRKSKRVLSV